MSRHEDSFEKQERKKVALKLKEYRSSFDRGPALADYLPYDSHDDGIFILKDGSLGMMWSLATITEEGLSEEERDRVRVAIEGVVMRIPAELACQIILVSSSRIEPVLQNFLSIGNLADSMTKLFLDSRMEVIREAAKNGFPGSGGEFRPRILSIYFTIRYFLGWQKPGLADSVLSVLVRPGLLKNSYETSYKRGRERFGRLARFVEAILSGAGFGPKPVSPQELISVLYPILNPVRATKLGEPVYHPAQSHLRTGCAFHHERAAAGAKVRGSRNKGHLTGAISGSDVSRDDLRTAQDERQLSHGDQLPRAVQRKRDAVP